MIERPQKGEFSHTEAITSRIIVVNRIREVYSKSEGLQK